MVYQDGPPVAHTGGFDEPTCHACHFGSDLNAPGGEFNLSFPATYVPGDTHLVSISQQHAEMKIGGFQLASRLVGGEQAGLFLEPDSTLEITVSESGIQYVHHSQVGSKVKADGAIGWSFRWVAPDTVAGPVIVHAVANAANGDDSEFGDFVYQTSVTIHTARP